MASLIDWGRKKKDELERQVTNNAVTRGVSRAIDQVNIADGGRTWKQRTPTTTSSARNQVAQSVANNSVGTGLRAVRTATSALQGVSGIADLAGKSQGTSRFSKGLDRFAAATDNKAKQMGVNAGYQVAAPGTEAVSFLAGGGLIKGSGYVASKAPVINKVAQTVTKSRPVQAINTAVNNKAINLSKQGFKGQVKAAVLKAGTSPSNIANMAGGTGIDLGVEASKGRDISKADVALSAGANLGFGFGLPVAGVAARNALPASAKVVKATEKARNAAINRTDSIDGANSLVRKLDKENKTIQKQIANLPVDNYRAAEILQKKLDRNVTIQKQAKAAAPQRNVVQKVTDRILTAQPGNSMKAVHSPDLDPKQNEFIEQYAEMLKSQGQGNGVSITPDGRRVSSNMRDADVKGERLTNSYWFDKARKDLESGRGAYGASDEFKALKNAQEEPLEMPPGFEDAPTSVPTTTPTLPKQREALPAQTQASTKTESVSLPNSTTRERGAVTSMKAGGPKGSDEFTAALEKRDNTYTQRNTKALQTKAINLITDNEDAALRVAKNGTDDKAVATSLELISKYIKDGRIEAAIDLAEDVAPKLTEAGRTAQAASIWGKVSTPAGALRFTQRQLDKYNADAGLVKNGVQAGNKQPRKLTPQKAKEITDLAGEIQKLPDGESKLKAIAKLNGVMNSVAPTPLLTKLTNIWRAGLLTSARTLEGGIIGNTAKLALDLPAQTVAAGLDKFVTAPLLNKGVRSNALTVSGRASGGKEGIKKGANYLKTGIDPRDVGRGYDTKKMNLEDGNKVVNTLGKGAEYVYRAMGTIDNPFYYSALKAAQREQLSLEAINKGLKGSAKSDYIKAGKLTTLGEERAANDALAAVFQNDTSLGTIAAKFKNAPQGIKNPQSRAAAQAVVDILVPFVKIPSAVATALVDYSPVGLVAEVAKQGFRRELDIRNLNNAIGKATVGTAGGIFIGAKLYLSGNLTLEAPQDTNERQLWALEGKQPFSIKINGKWRKLNYVQPIGSLMAVGGGFERAKAAGENPYVSSIASGLKAVSDQSFLKGVSGAMAAVQDPARSADTFVNSTVGSVVPNFIRDLARATDPYERKVTSVTDSLKNGVPGLRRQNLTQRDPFGNSIERKQSAFGAMFDPFKSTTDKTDPVTSEIRRIYELDRENVENKVAPSKLTKQQTFAGEKVVLTPKQLDNFEATVGPEAYSQIATEMKTSQFKAYSDTDKAKKIENIISSVRNNAKPTFAANNELKDKKSNVVAPDASKFKTKTSSISSSAAAISDKADARTKKVLGEYNTLDADTRKKKAYGEKDYDYKVALAKFENDKASGKLNRVQLINREQAVKKAAVGQKFDKDLRDIYSGLDTDEVYNLITTDKDGNRIANELLAYGDALAKVTGDKNKFRNKQGAVVFGTKPKGSGSGTSAGLTALLNANEDATGIKIKAQTSSAPRTAKVTAPKRAALKQYNVKKPKVSLRQLASIR